MLKQMKKSLRLGGILKNKSKIKGMADKLKQPEKDRLALEEKIDNMKNTKVDEGAGDMAALCSDCLFASN